MTKMTKKPQLYLKKKKARDLSGSLTTTYVQAEIGWRKACILKDGHPLPLLPTSVEASGEETQDHWNQELHGTIYL